MHLLVARKLLRGRTSVRVAITRSRLDRLRQLDNEIKTLAQQVAEIGDATGTSLPAI